MENTKKKPYTIPLGSKAPDFHLKATDGKTYSLKDFQKGKGFVIFFTCNHCPYVTGSDEITKKTALKYLPFGISFIAINSNSENTYPEDSFGGMVKRMDQHQFPWKYLHDSTQEIARIYGALKTPHFFLFNTDNILIYTGRALDNPRHPDANTQNDLERILDEYVNGNPISTPVTNPIGCNIKWEGKPAKWMPDEACDLC